MKLFVWDEVLTDYTDGIMFALARDADHARAIIRAQCGYVPADDLGKEPKEYDLTEPVCRIVWGGS